jgi:hypothetical protein
MSVRNLAITIGTIVVIGAIVTWLTGGQIFTIITDVWNGIWQWIQTTFMS